MENQHAVEPSSDTRSTMAEPAEVKPTAIGDLIEVKQEFDIKLEEDEVDTIEYTAPLNQLAEIFVPKMEKTEPDDSDDDGEVDNPWELFDRFGYLDSFNSKANMMPRSVAGAKTMDNASSWQGRASDERVAITQRSRGDVNNDNRTRTIPTAKSNATTSTANHAGRYSMIENIPNLQSTSIKGRKQHRCTECDYVGTQSSNLKQHMLKHTGEKPFPCKHCPKRFKEKRSLQSHMKVHVKKGSLNCSICLEVFASKTELVDHESTCEQRRYECHLCKKFSTFNISELKMHMRVHNGIRPFKCCLCSMKFALKSNLTKHMGRHTNPRSRPVKFQCSVCARNFSEQTEKDEHELNCIRRRYECYLCQSLLIHQKSQLQYHMRIQHTGERPFKCKFCEKYYASKSDMNSHMKRVHKQ